MAPGIVDVPCVFVSYAVLLLYFVFCKCVFDALDLAEGS